MSIKKIIVLPLLSFCLASPVYAAVIVSHDINTFGTFVAGSQEEIFAVNVANFLTNSSVTKTLLIFESNPGDGTRNFSTGVLNSLSNAGFSVTVTSDYNTSFASSDAVFVAQDFPTIGFLDNTSLINYVNGGGGVYLAGGVGLSASTEATGWSTFLNNFGLAFSSSGYNGINNVAITSPHSIFTGITSLASGNGQSIIDLGTNPNAEIVQFAGNEGVYAVASPVPLPPALLLFGSSLIGLLGIALQRQNSKKIS